MVGEGSGIDKGHFLVSERSAGASEQRLTEFRSEYVG